MLIFVSCQQHGWHGRFCKNELFLHPLQYTCLMATKTNAKLVYKNLSACNKLFILFGQKTSVIKLRLLEQINRKGKMILLQLFLSYFWPIERNIFQLQNIFDIVTNKEIIWTLSLWNLILVMFL